MRSKPMRLQSIYCVPLNLAGRALDWCTQGRQVARARRFVGVDHSALLTGGSSTVIAHLGLACDSLSIATASDYPEIVNQMFVDIVDGSIAVIALLCAEILPVPWTCRHRSRHTMKGRRNVPQATTAVRRRYWGTLARLADWQRSLGSFLAGGTATVTSQKDMKKTEAARVTGPPPVQNSCSGATSSAPRPAPGRVRCEPAGDSPPAHRQLHRLPPGGPGGGPGQDVPAGRHRPGEQRRRRLQRQRLGRRGDRRRPAAGHRGRGHQDGGLRRPAAPGCVQRERGGAQCVFEGELKPDGATQIARLREGRWWRTPCRASRRRSTTPPLGYRPPAATSSPSSGWPGSTSRRSTPLGRHRVKLHLLTDGLQTAAVNLTDPSLTADQTSALAEQLPVTALPPDTTVEINGIGKETGDLPRSTPSRRSTPAGAAGPAPPVTPPPTTRP